MKNEPVVTYNHMEEDETSAGIHQLHSSHHRNPYPISLYMILVVDVILISAVVYIAIKTIF